MTGRGRGRGSGYSSRGRGKKPRGGRGGRHIATAEEVEARNAELSRPAAAARGFSSSSSSSEDEAAVAAGRAAADAKKAAASQAARSADAPPARSNSAHSSSSSEGSGDEDTQVKFKRPLDFLRNQKKAGEETSEDEDDLCSNMGGLKVSQPQLTRREREAIEQQRRQRHYEKLHAEGKTPEAKADLARLAEVRQRREEAARLRAQGGG